MAHKVAHPFVIILWLSLSLLFLHGWFSSFRLTITNGNDYLSSSHYTLTTRNRRALASKFDFTPFTRHHHRRNKPDGGSSGEIDPLYGTEKRRVPTGPNPLHH
ncbi:hypothetical protein NMG60_11005854 [Bertholletia excelsa]